jgi:hypothetical protein
MNVGKESLRLEMADLRRCILNTVAPAEPKQGFKIVCASVLFFGSIARAVDSRPLQASLAALAVLLFLSIVFALTRLPDCHQ